MSGHALLLVDDSPEDVQLILRALHRVVPPDDVAVCSDGQEALDYLFAEGAHAGRNASEQPSVVVLDLNLPRVSGLEVLRRLRAAQPTRLMPVVILSASVEQKDVRAAAQLGANSYVRKSLDYARLSETMTLLARYWLELNIAPPAPSQLD